MVRVERVRSTEPDYEVFRFRAGRWSLDFCSTLLWRLCEPVEQLRSPSDLARWTVEAGLLPRRPSVTVDETQGARELREAIYRILGACVENGPVPRVALRVLNDAARHPDRVPQLTSSGVVRWDAIEPVAAALATVARDAIDLVTGLTAGRLRQCAASDCAFFFVDTSRSGARRWCATNRCGNRNRVRAFRARQRGATPARPDIP